MSRVSSLFLPLSLFGFPLTAYVWVSWGSFSSALNEWILCLFSFFFLHRPAQCPAEWFTELIWLPLLPLPLLFPITRADYSVGGGKHYHHHHRSRQFPLMNCPDPRLHWAQTWACEERKRMFSLEVLYWGNVKCCCCCCCMWLVRITDWACHEMSHCTGLHISDNSRQSSAGAVSPLLRPTTTWQLSIASVCQQQQQSSASLGDVPIQWPVLLFGHVFALFVSTVCLFRHH